MTMPTISLVVTEQLYSALGKVLCTTIPVINGSSNVLGFVDTLVSVRNTGGPIDSDSDVVNWAWANNAAITDTDRQYSYQGSFPEADPLLRQSQSSQPGQGFSY